jgi:hypothetical protein
MDVPGIGAALRACSRAICADFPEGSLRARRSAAASLVTNLVC